MTQFFFYLKNLGMVCNYLCQYHTGTDIGDVRFTYPFEANRLLLPALMLTTCLFGQLKDEGERRLHDRH